MVYEAKIQDWRMEGRIEGRAEGRAEGRVEGRAEGRADAARQMLRKSYSLDDISWITGLTKEDLQKLQKEMALY